MTKRIFISLLLAAISWGSAFALTVDNLRVQSLRNPSGIDTFTPQFSWQLQSDERGVLQTSYQLVVSQNADGSNPIYDSGIVESSQSANVTIALSLLPASRYYWHVTVNDNKGQKATSTETAFFETGLLSSGWSGAKWIKATDLSPQDAAEEITDYVVEGKIQIEHTAAGLCFAMQDASNFYFWQLNIEGAYPRLRPHVWANGNPACLDNIDLRNKVELNNTDEFTLRIEVSEASHARTYINNVLVDERTGNFKFGRVGMREDHGELDGQEEIGVYDDIIVKKSDGTPLFSEDFSSGNSFTGGTITNNEKLRIIGSKTNHVLVWQKQTDDSNIHYAVDFDMYLVKSAAAMIFAYTSSNTYHMWQINCNDNNNPAVRHHIYINGNLTWNDAQFTQFSKADLVGKKHHYRIEVEGNKIYTFIDDILVDTYTDNTGSAVKGDIGMRVDNNTGEEAYYDNIVVTEYDKDEKPTITLSEDFEALSSDNFFDANIEELEGSRMCHVKSPNAERKVMQTRTKGMPMFRKTFNIEKKVASAVLFTSGLGVYDLFMNGQRVGHLQPDGSTIFEEMKPGWTDYRKRVFYSTHDVTSLLSEGKNALCALVTTGWWAGAVMHGAYGSPELGFLAKLLITYNDGSQDEVVSDLSWLSSKNGAMKLGDIYDGEIYDARLIEPWTTAQYDDSHWNAVRENIDFKGEINAFTGGYVLLLPEHFKQVKTATIYEGSTPTGTDFGMANVITTQQGPAPITVKKGQSVLFDFGQNIVGWVNFKVKGKSGNRLKMRFVEMLNDNGSRSRGNDGPGGTPYLANLRSAKASLYYTLQGDEDGEQYHPSTTFFGFRYCEITPGDDVEILAIEAQPISSSTDEMGSLETSNEMVNQLFSNINWGQRGNLLSIPTDCPQRDERLGWTADTQVFSRTGMFNAHMESFYRKWMQDMRDGQNNEGAYPGVAPENWGTPFGQCVWADAGILVPYNIYMMTGNIEALRENYESMTRYMDFLSTQVFDGYKYNGGGLTWGDWLSFVTTDTRYIAVAYYGLDAQLMATMSKALSQAPNDIYAQKAQQYEELYQNIKSEFRSRYITPTIRQNTQTAFLMALQYNMLEGDTEINTIKDRLSKAIIRNKYKLNTGFAGTAILNTTLSRFGMTDLAYDLLLQRECPSWLYSVDQGATTIWERWNSYTIETGFGDPGMNSFNHYAYGAVGEWMYRYMLGIEWDEQDPGFHHIILQPKPDYRTTLPEGQQLITSASGHHHSYYGDIRSAWQSVSQDEFTYDCTVPANTTATLLLPVADEQTPVYENNISIEESEGIEYIGYADGCKVFRLGSGTYHFTTHLKISAVTLPSASEGKGSAETFYDLLGRNISNVTPAKGIYISDGKKYLKK